MSKTNPEGQSQWYSLMMRLQETAKASLATSRNGACISTITIIFDHAGAPLLWTEPRPRRIEPASRVIDILLQEAKFGDGVDTSEVLW